MKFSKQLTKYLMLLCFFSAFGVYFCKSTLFQPCRLFIISYFPFYILKGENEFISNLLIGISTSALFAALGFFINYYDIKKKRQEQLIFFYIKMRNMCFENIFYEKNYYDDKHDEVNNIFNYLNENKNNILDYRPPFLLLKVRILRIFKKKSNKDLFKYINEDKYALIADFFSDMYQYFGFINMLQCSIKEIERVIKLYEDKKDKAVIKYNEYIKRSDEFNAKLSKIDIEAAERCLKLMANLVERERKKLKSRYPYNTTKFQTFTNKKDLIAKCYAIDSKFEEYISSYYFGELEALDEIIVEDTTLLFEPSDDRLKMQITKHR